MKSDISRSIFDPKKRYTGVRQQQGRVQLDADWNEQVDITNHRLESTATDVIGGCGTPADRDGFKLKITEDGKKIRILAAHEIKNPIIKTGHFYVDGIRCEIDEDALFTAQPHFPGAKLPRRQGDYIAYLDVWQRHITEIDDPGLHERALGNVDTTTRTQTVWQVKLLRLSTGADNKKPCHSGYVDWDNLINRRPRLAAQAVSLQDTLNEPGTFSTTDTRKIENQLYRVEIHTPGTMETATFKWSRDNGSVVAALAEKGINTDSNTILLSEPPRDKERGFEAGHWVEIIDETLEMRDGRGVLVKLTNQTDGIKLTYDPDTVIGAIDASRFNKPESKTKVRRWDQGNLGEIPVRPEWIYLDPGVQVRFDCDSSQSEETPCFQTGDYWLIPARVIGKRIDWPLDENEIPIPQDREGIAHHYCRLTILHRDGSGIWQVKHDCRKLFTPLADQLNLFYVKGDGQAGAPGEVLGEPLIVGVTNGLFPLAGIKVNFAIMKGNGCLYNEGDTDCATREDKPEKKDEIDIETNERGEAICNWKLEPLKEKVEDIDKPIPARPQQVMATLRDENNITVHLPIFFNANLSQFAIKVFYDLPNCEQIDSIRTIFSRLKDEINKFPDNPDVSTVNNVLNALLCKLTAANIPFKPKTNCGVYSDIQEKTVGDALNAICNLAAGHVAFTKPDDCGDTILPETANTVQLALEALCKLTAGQIGFTKPDDCENNVFPDGTDTVQKALDALCNISVTDPDYNLDSDKGGCANGENTIHQLLVQNREFQENGVIKFSEILKTILCKLKASEIPYEKPEDNIRHPDDPQLLPDNVESHVGSALDYLSNHFVPSGAIMAFANENPPKGWLECNGDNIAQEKYPDLLAAIGMRFNDDSTSTDFFKLPDLRGEFIRGWIHGRTNSPDDKKPEMPDFPDDELGREPGSWQEDTFQTHTHEEKDENARHQHQYQSHSHGANIETDLSITVNKNEVAGPPTETGPQDTTGDNLELGGPIQLGDNGAIRVGKETRPRNVALMYCIKY